jgi:hypothetical protein
VQDESRAGHVAQLESEPGCATDIATQRPTPDRAELPLRTDPSALRTPTGPTIAHPEVRVDPAHPAVLVDPRPATFLAVRSLRRHGVSLHVLASDRLDPTYWASGVRRHRLPRITDRPQAWTARLLGLAAHLEPRPLLLPFSKPARELLRESREILAPHYELGHLEPLDVHEYEAEEFRTERALRRAVLRGEPAFEVQVILDRAGTCTGACILTWVAGVSPCVVVTSVEGQEVLERSVDWLRQRGVCGYARLIWAPDRFGRVELQAAGTLPGSGWALACADGVDLPALWYASVAGVAVERQQAHQLLSRQILMSDPSPGADAIPMVQPSVPWSSRDPLPSVVAFVRSLLER